jgi:hypothetical protein
LLAQEATLDGYACRALDELLHRVVLEGWVDVHDEGAHGGRAVAERVVLLGGDVPEHDHDLRHGHGHALARCGRARDARE